MNSDSTSTDREERLHQILADYYLALDAGRAPTRDQLCAKHPELADAICLAFADMQAVAGQLDPEEPTPHTRTRTDVTPTRVHGRMDASSSFQALPLRLGNYELEEELARGGMGIVYRARQIGLNRQVAVKMIQGGPTASDEDLQRFRLEAEAAARLDHPNIVPIHEVGVWQGRHFFSMKLIEGGSLAERMQELQSDHRACAILMATVARAVHYAHDQGILHRDLKPGNILLGRMKDESGGMRKVEPASSLPHPSSLVPYVTDFGLAKRLQADSQLTQTGAIVGTPSYMAPEQAVGDRALTPAVDVYGLGAILYHLLTGKRPFQADSPMATLLQVQTLDVVRPRAIVPDLPRDLETICLKCLARDPSARYPTARDLAEDLERFARNEPILAKPPGLWHRSRSWVQRHPLLTAISVTAACFALIALGIYADLSHRLADQEAQARQRDQRRQEEEQERVRNDLTRYVELLRKAEENSKGGAGAHYLQSCPPDLRSWEWSYLNRPHRIMTSNILEPHKGWQFAPDSTSFGAVSIERVNSRVNLWYAPNFSSPKPLEYGAKLFTLLGHDKGVAAWSLENKLCYWALDPYRQLLIFPDPVPDLTALAAASDGSRFIAGDQLGNVFLWSVTTVKQEAKFSLHDAPITFVHVHDRHVVSATAKSIKVSDVSDGSEIFNRTGKIAAVAVHPTGNVLAWMEAPDHLVIHQRTTGVEHKIKLGFHGSGLAFTRDGLQLAVWSPQNIRLMDAESGRVHAQVLNHVGDPIVQLASNCRRALAGATDKTIQIVNVLPAAHFPARQCVALAGDHIHLACATDNHGVRLWNLLESTRIRDLAGHQGPVLAVAFDTTSKRLASSAQDRTIRLWKIEDGSCTSTLAQNSTANALAFHPHEPLLASAHDCGALILWDVEQGMIRRTLLDEGSPLFNLCFSADGRWLIAGGADKIVRAWPVDGGEPVLLEGCGADVQSVSMHPDCRTVAALATDRTIRLWNLQTPNETRTIVPPQPASCMTFTHDGKRLVLGGQDRTVRLIETRTGIEVFALPAGDGEETAPPTVGNAVRPIGPPRGITAVAVSPNGQWLAAVDHLARAWLAPPEPPPKSPSTIDP